MYKSIALFLQFAEWQKYIKQTTESVEELGQTLDEVKKSEEAEKDNFRNFVYHRDGYRKNEE